jgi:hypothetical protein
MYGKGKLNYHSYANDGPIRLLWANSTTKGDDLKMTWKSEGNRKEKLGSVSEKLEAGSTVV